MEYWEPEWEHAPTQMSPPTIVNIHESSNITGDYIV